MKTLRVSNRSRGTLLGSHVRLADRLWSRVRGYLARPEPEEGEGILLVPCNAVHTFGVPFPLDILFLGADGTVLDTEEELRPWRWTRRVSRARYVLEVPSGTIRASETERGDELTWAAPRAGAPRLETRPGRPEAGRYASAGGRATGRRKS